jgi:hypothetical protein
MTVHHAHDAERGQTIVNHISAPAPGLTASKKAKE